MPEQYVLLTDLSSMDGRITQVVRDLERRILCRFYKPKYHEEVMEYHRNSYNRDVVITNKRGESVKYNMGTARGSGSRATSLFNTYLSAIMTYCSYRRSGRDREAAWDHLGVFGGDDGLTGDLAFDTYKQVAAEFGQKATGKTVVRGEVGVEFLSRWYTGQIWHGTPQSNADFGRALGNFHLSSLKAPQGVVAYHKARGYLVNDAATPILGDLCRAVLRNARRCGVDRQFISEADIDRITPWFARRELQLDSILVESTRTVPIQS
jgi:hypothetical protein